MNFANIDRRLRRIEADHRTGAPTRIMADRPLSEDEAAEALTDWRAMIATGRATLGNGVLWILAPVMTAEAWEATHVTERETVH